MPIPIEARWNDGVTRWNDGSLWSAPAAPAPILLTSNDPIPLTTTAMEFWEITKQRSQETLPVWNQYLPALKVGGLGTADLEALIDGFEPLVQGFVRAPYGDVDAIKTIAANNPNVVAMLVEPIQGEGGVNIPASDYLNELREICNQHAWLLMLDEVQTGNGRTGKYFAYQHNGIIPDVVTTAKGLGNGFPIGACLAKGIAAELFQPGNHGSTYGGSALACATAQTVVDTLVQDKLIERAAELGAKLLADFQSELAECKHVIAVRGKGLMLGIELKQDCPTLVAQAAEQGLLINVTAGKVIRLLPTLILSDADAMLLVSTLCNLIRKQA